MNISLQKYLIEVGMRSAEYNYDKEILFANIPYFSRCLKSGLSPYKALLFLGDFIKGEYKI